MIDTVTIIDNLDLEDVRAYARQLSRLVDRLLAEREAHLQQVEQAFSRRHNQQQKRIADLERELANKGGRRSA